MVSTRDRPGRLPLHSAAGCVSPQKSPWPDERAPSRAVATVKLLLRHSPVNDPDFSGNTPLHYAARGVPARFGTIRLLLKQGAEPRLVNGDGSTPAHMAPRSQSYATNPDLTDVSQGIETVLDLFVEAGGGDSNLLDQVDAAGLTPRGVLDEEQAELARKIAGKKREEEGRRGMMRFGGRVLEADVHVEAVGKLHT